ncbi:phage protein Gp27 family protein [Acetobacter persici]|uniref:phage protein Gp27 family protein n=1 Tax=Acetobacter persici TaxID=1076596 RepID=UPI0034A586D6
MDKLPQEIRDEIDRLRANGHSIDEIITALRELDITDISRSSLGRHLHKREKLTAQLVRTKAMAEALAKRTGEGGASQFARANIELLHGIILDLHMEADGEGDATSWLETLKGNPKGVEALAKALDHLTRASKTDAEFVKEIEAQTEARMRRQAEKAVNQVAKKQGLSTATVEALMAGMFGVKRGKE